MAATDPSAKDRQIEVAKTLRVGDRVDFADSAARHPGDKHHPQPSTWSHDDSRRGWVSGTEFATGC